MMKTYETAIEELLDSRSLRMPSWYSETPIPSGVTREDIHVEVEVKLERKKDRKHFNRPRLANVVKHVAHKDLHKIYTATHPDNCRLILKVYVVLASDGSNAGRLFSSTHGAVKECLAWVLYEPDKSVVYASGRVGATDQLKWAVHEFGHFSAADNILFTKLTPELVNDIVAAVNHIVKAKKENLPSIQ